MKLATNIYHVGENCWKCVQGQMSKVKVTANEAQSHVAYSRQLYSREAIINAKNVIMFCSYLNCF